jgi:uncharacterized protein
MRIAIRVRPGSARPRVGGEDDGALIVRVSAQEVDGKATEAAVAAVADSFGVRRNAVRLVSGASSRTKIVDIDTDVSSRPCSPRPVAYARDKMTRPYGRQSLPIS